MPTAPAPQKYAWIHGSAVSGVVDDPAKEVYTIANAYAKPGSPGTLYVGFVTGQFNAGTDVGTVIVTDPKNGTINRSGTWEKPDGSSPKPAFVSWIMVNGKVSAKVTDALGATLAEVPVGPIQSPGQILCDTK